LIPVPMTRMAESKAGNKIMSNTVGLGAILGLTGYPLDMLEGVLRDSFKKEDVFNGNIAAARAGYEYIKEKYGKAQKTIDVFSNARRMVIDGNQAIALGAIAAGCKFMSAYPMTPATPVMEYLAARQKELGLVVVQAEDEISAINMTIGAGYTGARAMTATSGGGFCLMVEGFGLAGMTETPIVVAMGQRPGPAIGLPTRMAQADLRFVMHASHGEFPRAVFAPGSASEAFWCTIKAFNIAEKFQTPAVILYDHYIADSYFTVDEFDVSRVTIDRNSNGPGTEKDPAKYKRHLITESGISPRLFPMQTEALVDTDSDEHDEGGHITEDAGITTKMIHKRMRKLFGMRQEIAEPSLFGPKNAETTLVGWGSTLGPMKEAMEILHGEKKSVNVLHFSEIWPFRGEMVADILQRSKFSYAVENNYSGQFADLIRQETGVKVKNRILKYDGRPFGPEYIVREVKREGC
jgi:2-oxoglutarate/2-oxoacid ferredoxin oxidoreductase subunit alpha